MRSLSTPKISSETRAVLSSVYRRSRMNSSQRHLTKPRYEPKPKRDGTGDCGVFDTFAQEFVFGEKHNTVAAATRAAKRINDAYERTFE